MASPSDELEAERRSKKKELDQIQKAISSGNLDRGRIEALESIQANIVEKLSRIKDLQRRSNEIAQEELEAHLKTIRGGSAASDARSVTKDSSGGPVREPYDSEEAKRRLQKAGQVAGHTIKTTGRAAWWLGGKGVGAARGAYISGKGVVGATNQLVQQHSGTIAFIVIAVCVVLFEFYSVYAGDWPTRVGIYTVLVFITLLFFRDFELTKRAALAAIVMNVIWYAYLSASGNPAFSDQLNSQLAKAIVTVLLLPAFAWWFLYLEPNVEIAKFFRGIGWIPIAGIMLALVYPALTSAAGLIPTPATGFDPQPAARDAVGFILSGAGEALRDFVCYIGIGGGACSAADSWLARITEPFAYDATTVHEIQNHNLGVYIRDASVDGTVEVSGYRAGSFLPKSIDFYVHAPIPEDIEIDLCNARAEDLKAFPGICDNSIRITCTVDDVASTQIIPRSELSIRGAVASLGSLFSCRMLPPSDRALSRAGATVSKRAQVMVEYPFVTTTFKLIRAVSINHATSREALSELRNFRESRVISSGGPVIVEVTDSEFMTVYDTDPGDGFAQESLIIRLRAEPEVRIDGIDQMIVFVPNGSRLESTGPGSYCEFREGDEIVSEHRAICDLEVRCDSGLVDCGGTCIDQGLYDAIDPRECEDFGRESGSRDDTNMCRNELEELIGESMLERPSKIYLLSADAINRINADLGNGAFDQESGWVAARARTNNIDIGCRLVVDDRTEFLQEERLVTERALNIITSYRVSHAQDLTVRFSGIAEPIPQLTPSQALCSIEGLSTSIPTGIMPVSGSVVRLTEPFGTTPRSNKVGYHKGVDLAGSYPGDDPMIRSSWDGTIVQVVSDCRNGAKSCGGGYGNYVLIRTDTRHGTFLHRYAHLDQNDQTLRNLKKDDGVYAGQPLGKMGDTGQSTGVHLHFEVEAENAYLNPLYFLPESEVRALGGFDTVFSRAVALKSHYRISCIPITHDYTSDEIVGVREAASNIANKFGVNDKAHKVSLVIDAAIEQGIPPDVLLGVAMQENQFNHRVGIGNQGIWTSRSGETIALSVDGESVGMMQIQAVGKQTICQERWREYQQKNPDVSSYADAHVDLRFHISCSAEILKDKYKEAERLLGQHGAYCGARCICDPEKSEYIEEFYDQRTIFPPSTDQWIAAVKGYNGWGCQPTEAEARNYVNKVFVYAGEAREAASIVKNREDISAPAGSPSGGGSDGIQLFE
jgi:hypothetical protein